MKPLKDNKYYNYIQSQIDEINEHCVEGKDRLIGEEMALLDFAHFFDLITDSEYDQLDEQLDAL